jgi:hypothetical protein
LTVEIYPAFFSPPAVGRLSVVSGVDEASCFYHADNRAVVACDACGRFLCSVCDVDLDDLHLCPTCLRQGRRKGSIAALENERMLYDGIALRLAIYPIFFVWPTLLTAPAVIWVVLWYWRTPGSLVRSMRWCGIVAILLALLQIAGWLVAAVMVATR